MSELPSEPELTIDRALVVRSALGLLVVLAVAAACGILLREPITDFAEFFIGRFGWGGVFLGVLFTDSSPLPLTHEPILLLAIAMGRSPWLIGLVGCTASVCAGPVGWLGGFSVRQVPGARVWLEARAPGMVAFLRRWGATGVAIAALTPIPFAVSTWTAGLVGVPLPRVFAASLLRIPKTWFYLGLLVSGWSLGA